VIVDGVEIDPNTHKLSRSLHNYRCKSLEEVQYQLQWLKGYWAAKKGRVCSVRDYEVYVLAHGAGWLLTFPEL
jgi:hypothetical protein